MSEIRTESTVRHSSRNGVTIYASGSFKDPAPLLRYATSHSRLSFRLDPLVKLLARINIDAQEHLGVLCAAVLCALAEIQSRFMRIDPHVVDAIWNQICLSCKPWHPEAMFGIRRNQGHKGRCGMRRVAHRYMQFIGRDHTQSGITKFPPELMADGNDLNRCGRLRSILDRMDYACGGEEQHQHDEHRDHRPCEFHLIAAINLRRFAAVVGAAPAILRDGIHEQAENNYKN